MNYGLDNSIILTTFYCWYKKRPNLYLHSEFISAKLTTVAGKQNLNRLRKCPGKWKFCRFNLHITIKEVA